MSNLVLSVGHFCYLKNDVLVLNIFRKYTSFPRIVLIFCISSISLTSFGQTNQHFQHFFGGLRTSLLCVLSTHTFARERRYDIEIWQTESCEPRVVPIRGRICNSNRPEQFVSSALYVKEFYLYCMLISGVCKLITRCEISSYAGTSGAWYREGTFSSKNLKLLLSCFFFFFR